MESSIECPQKIKNRTTPDPAIPLLSVCLKELKLESQRDICTAPPPPHLRCSLIHKSQDVETILMTSDG